ncbi:MAG TPA: TIR domain-containing protein [Chitinophagales bacterium]|nr:TIR domain-containing protein [Chitinophagales bacterium]
MAKQRIFITFDYDNDSDIKVMLAGQAKLEDSPFDFADGSVKEHLTGDWKKKVKGRMGNCDQVIVLCGESTHTATGVSAELEIAQELGKPYFLLWGRASKACVKPNAALSTDKIYNWTWANLKALIGGSR